MSYFVTMRAKWVTLYFWNWTLIPPKYIFFLVFENFILEIWGELVFKYLKKQDKYWFWRVNSNETFMRDFQTLLQYSVISRQQHKKIYLCDDFFWESCKTVADVVTNERNAFFLLVDPGLLYLRLEIKKQQRRHLFKAFIFSIIRNWHPV